MHAFVVQKLVISCRFAKVKLIEDPKAQDPISSLGPDAFVDLPPVAEFIVLLAKQRRPLKALLIDQSFLSGIGNWVADEILYQASIYPETRANAVSDMQAELLHTAIHDVLKVAVDAGARSENFPSSWLFHHRCVTLIWRSSVWMPSLSQYSCQCSASEEGLHICQDLQVDRKGFHSTLQRTYGTVSESWWKNNRVCSRTAAKKCRKQAQTGKR